ncbi:MAG: metal-dependent transcriptional regulator [Candidatus Heimdallarchaeota archaeon]|nr:metal-dependent transcriptional regulator [Candidatus Heimdallarchaeota archaeon]
MNQAEVTHAEEEYLETFFWFFEYGNKHVKTNQIAEMMNVDPGTVTSMFKKLSKKGYINYKPYYGAELTPKGEDIARKVVRMHRLSESFLEWLGLPWAMIHEEACKWEHVLTEEIAEMIEKKLKPERTPYGAMIPPKVGISHIPTENKPLARFSPNNKIVIVEIIERAIARHFPHEATLQEVYIELEEKGLKPETEWMIISTKVREDATVEDWALSYDLDMTLENKDRRKIKVPYYLVNMILAKKISS